MVMIVEYEQEIDQWKGDKKFDGIKDFVNKWRTRGLMDAVKEALTSPFGMLSMTFVFLVVIAVIVFFLSPIIKAVAPGLGKAIERWANK